MRGAEGQAGVLEREEAWGVEPVDADKLTVNAEVLEQLLHFYCEVSGPFQVPFTAVERRPTANPPQ